MMNVLFLKMFLICGLISKLLTSSANSVYSSCTGRGVTGWNKNKRTISLEIRSWLQSMVSLRFDVRNNVDNVSSMLYSPRWNDESSVTKFSKHTFGYNDVLSGDHTDDNDSRRRTVSKFSQGLPTGLTWQWRSKRQIEGMLYGHVDLSGKFTGHKIIFIYPDFLTGIKGKFLDGELVSGVAVDVVGERCNIGLKEIIVEPSKHDPEVIWRKEPNSNQLSLPHYVGQHPCVMDPHERKSVYIDESTIPGANEGMFARYNEDFSNLVSIFTFFRRKFSPGDLVSYFSGQKTFAKLMFHSNMTKQIESEVGAYFFNLGANSPKWWDVHTKTVIEIPIEFR